MQESIAAIPWGYKQPKTRSRVGTKKQVRSLTPPSSLSMVQKTQTTRCDVNSHSPWYKGHRNSLGSDFVGRVVKCDRTWIGASREWTLR